MKFLLWILFYLLNLVIFRKSLDENSKLYKFAYFITFGLGWTFRWNHSNSQKRMIMEFVAPYVIFIHTILFILGLLRPELIDELYLLVSTLT